MLSIIKRKATYRNKSDKKGNLNQGCNGLVRVIRPSAFESFQRAELEQGPPQKKIYRKFIKNVHFRVRKVFAGPNEEYTILYQ